MQNSKGQDTSKKGLDFKGHSFLDLERSSAIYLLDDFRPREESKSAFVKCEY